MTLRDAPNLGFRIEAVTDDEGTSFYALLPDDVPAPGDVSTVRAATDEEIALWRALRRAETVAEAAETLYEQVQMNESAGICLDDRVPTLLLGEALAVWREGKNG